MSRRIWIALLVAGAGVGVGGCVLVAMYQRWQMVEPPIWSSVAATVVVAVPLAVLLWRRNRPPGQRPVMFLGMVWSGVFCAAFVLIGYAAALNAWLDHSPPRRHPVKVIEPKHQRGGYRSTIVESWNHPGETEELWVPVALDDRSHIVVVTRDGFFGFEWVDEMTAP